MQQTDEVIAVYTRYKQFGRKVDVRNWMMWTDLNNKCSLIETAFDLGVFDRGQINGKIEGYGE